MTSSSTQTAYTFKQGLTAMAAKAIGIDPALAVAAGEGARAAINALRKATKVRSRADRLGFVRAAQAEMKSISSVKHGTLVNALQAKLLALQGRGEDTEMAHLTPGELVLPRSLQTPSLMKKIAELADRQGIDLRQFVVGHSSNKVNPFTIQKRICRAMHSWTSSGLCLWWRHAKSFRQDQALEDFPTLGLRICILMTGYRANSPA